MNPWKELALEAAILVLIVLTLPVLDASLEGNVGIPAGVGGYLLARLFNTWRGSRREK